MTAALAFVGPQGNYTIALPDAEPFEDKMLQVSGPHGPQDWHIDVAETAADGVRELSGMTAGPDASWFVLRLSQPAEISYWGDRVLLRADQAR